MKTPVIIVSLSFIILTACNNSAPNQASQQNSLNNNEMTANIFMNQNYLLPPNGFKSQMKSPDDEKGKVILDVRTTDEYHSGCIEGAVNIDYYSSNFETQLASLDKNAQYLVYCRSGNRSNSTIQMMKQMGFSDIYELQGGINSWNREGLPVNNC